MLLKIRPALPCAFVLLLSLVSAAACYAQTTTPAPAPCVIGYTLGFFNGVWNTELEAIDGRTALQDAFHQATANPNDTYNNEDVNFELFYNHTGGTVGATGLQDIAEVFVQRAQELDPTGALAKNGFYFFWEGFSGDTPGYASMAANNNSAIQTFIDNFRNAAVQGAVASLSALFSSPPTSSDYANQQAALDQLAAAGRKFVLVAHSQGNLFLNQAYDHVEPNIGATRVKAVHIAPASPTLRGDWVLADIDLVINGLRLAGGANSVPAINLFIPASTNDPSGHTLVDTYLDSNRQGRATVEGMLTAAFSGLQAATCPLTVSPASKEVVASQLVPLTATLNPAPQDPNVQISYGWAITGGTAGGTLVQSTGNSTTAGTLAPTITYLASANPTPGAIDTVTVTAYAGASVGDPSKDSVLGTATAVMTVSHVSVTLTPGSTTLNRQLPQSVMLTAGVPGASASGYSYHWHVSPAINGGQLVGSLEDGGSSTGGHSGTDYCSSDPVAQYSNTTETLGALLKPATDVVTVTVFSGAGCTAGTQGGVVVGQIGLPATAAVITDPNISVSLTASDGRSNITGGTIYAGDSATIEGTIVPYVFHGSSILWSTTGAVGTLSEVGGKQRTGQTSFCVSGTDGLSTSEVTYVPKVPPAAGAATTDTINAAVFTSTDCSGTMVGPLGTTTLTVSPYPISFPAPATITAGSSHTIQSTLLGPVPTTPSYLWSTPGTAGLLSAVGSPASSATTSLCTSGGFNGSPGPQVVYTANASIPNNIAGDTITLQVFNAPNCPAANLLGSASTSIAVTADIGPIAPWLGTWACTPNGGYNAGHTFKLVISVDDPKTQTLLLVTQYNYDGSGGGGVVYAYDQNAAYLQGSNVANATLLLAGSALTQFSTYTVNTFNGTTFGSTTTDVTSVCYQ